MTRAQKFLPLLSRSGLYANCESVSQKIRECLCVGSPPESRLQCLAIVRDLLKKTKRKRLCPVVRQYCRMKPFELPLLGRIECEVTAESFKRNLAQDSELVAAFPARAKIEKYVPNVGALRPRRIRH